MFFCHCDSDINTAACDFWKIGYYGLCNDCVLLVRHLIHVSHSGIPQPPPQRDASLHAGLQKYMGAGRLNDGLFQKRQASPVAKLWRSVRVASVKTF